MSNLTKPLYARYCGIDIAARTASVATLSPDAQPIDAFEIRQTSKDYARLRQRLEQKVLQPEQILVVLEPTSTYWLPLATDLYRARYDVVVINSLTARRHFNAQLNRNKTDRIDAHNLAEIGWLSQGRLTLWQEPPPIYEELRQRLALRDSLMEMRIKQRQRYQAAQSRLAIPALQAHRQQIVSFLNGKIAAVEREMQTILKADSEWGASARYLRSVPGFGLYTATALMTLTLNFSIIDSPDQLAAYLGIIPSETSSGQSTRRHLKHSSAPRLRQALYISTVTAIRCNPVIQRYYELQQARGKPGKVAIIACTRKLVRIGWGCVKNQMMFDPDYEVTRKSS